MGSFVLVKQADSKALAGLISPTKQSHPCKGVFLFGETGREA
jgi:hypothetical protein